MGTFFIETKSSQKILQTLQLMGQKLHLDSVVLLYYDKTEDELLAPRMLLKSSETTDIASQQILRFFEIFNPDYQSKESISDLKSWFEEKGITHIMEHFDQLQIFIYRPFSVGDRYFHLCLSKAIADSTFLPDNDLIEVFTENIASQLANSAPVIEEGKSKLANNELFHMIFNSVPEAISFHELPTHKTIAVNKAFLSYTGFSEEEVLLKTGHDLNLWYNESEREKYRELMEKDGFVQNFSASFRFKNGEKRVGLLSSKIILFDGNIHLLVIIRDIHELITTQQALKYSEIKFKSIFNLLPDAICINNLDKEMTLTDANQAFIENFAENRKLDTSQTRILQNIWEVEGQKDKFIEYSGKWQNIENMQARLRYRTGQVLENLVSSKILPIDGELHQLVLFKNIDDLMRMKKAIKMSEEKFRSIFNSSPDAINITRYHSAQIVDVNDSFIELTKYSKTELISKSILDFDFWQKPEDLQEYLDYLGKGQNVTNLETIIKVKNGTTINVLISASLVEINGELHIINITKNITHLKMTQLGLRESENRFRTIVEKSHASICIVDDQGQFIYLNPRSQFLFGYSLKELLGKKYENYIHPDSLATVNRYYFARQRGENVPEEYEFQIVRKNGELRDVEIRSSVYTDINGKIKTIAQLLDITDRKKALKENFITQQRNKEYIKIAAFMLIAMDKNAHIEMVNNKTCEILGYSENELLGKNWITKCVPSNYRKSTKERFEEIAKSKSRIFSRESAVLTKDGEERLIAWQTTPLFNEIGEFTGTLSSGEDITDKINTLKILEQSKVIAILWKFNPNSHVHPVVYVSNNVEHILGYKDQELLGGTPQYIDIIHPDDLSHVLNEVNTYTKTVNSPHYSHEYYRLRCKNGEYIWVEDQTELIFDENRKITHLSGLLIDVTEKKKSLEMIRESEERYRTIFNSNLDGIAIFNADGKIVEVNEVLCQMYGYSREEILNRKNQDELNIGSNLHIEQVKATLKLEQSIVSESIDTRKDGSTFHVNLKLHWIHYNNESHLLANIRDITDKKIDEIALLDAKNKAEESDRLKSSFLANMSHEIRTPMNSILGFADLLEDEDIEEDERSIFISRIKNNGELLLNLLNDIVDISKIEANQITFSPSNIEVMPFLESIADSFENQAETKNIKLSYSLPMEYQELIVYADSNRLLQIITNLISNSLKFTNVGGEIQFGLLPETDADYIVFFVKDNGIGIPKNQFDHIFTRFRQAHATTHADYGGTGLGLSISQGLIQNMGGQIWFESEENVGTQFFFSLPLNQ